MPVKYYEIKKLLRSQISLSDSIINKFLKYILLYGILVLLFIAGKSEMSSYSTKIILFLIFMVVACRLVILFERINIKNLAIYIKNEEVLDEDSTIIMLINDIESSLKKIASFANWSCGILATISIFVSTTYITLLKDIITKEELIKFFWLGNENGIENSFIGQMLLAIIFVLLGYYLTVQAFTYDRRFVIIVLKSSLYIDEDEEIKGFWKKLKHSLMNLSF